LERADFCPGGPYHENLLSEDRSVRNSSSPHDPSAPIIIPAILLRPFWARPCRVHDIAQSRGCTLRGQSYDNRFRRETQLGINTNHRDFTALMHAVNLEEKRDVQVIIDIPDNDQKKEMG
jgi:hypothetical protein